MKPKAHWMWDIFEQFATMARVLDAFIIERLHLRCRVIADDVKFTGVFERSALKGMVTNHWRRLQTLDGRSGLRGHCRPCPGVPGAQISDHMEFFGLDMWKGDVVCRGANHAGIVLALASEGGELFAVVQVMAFLATVTPHSSSWRPTAANQVWPAKELQAVIWPLNSYPCFPEIFLWTTMS